MPAIRRSGSQRPALLRLLEPSWPAVVLAAVACLILTGCEGSSPPFVGNPMDPESSDFFDMTGTWTMTINPNDPPWTVSCTEDLVGESFSFCRTFEVTVVQDGSFFLPDGMPDESDSFCDSIFVMTGSSTVLEITGVISRTRSISDHPPVSEVQGLEFRAGVVGDSGDFRLVQLTIRDVKGECTLGGSYVGLRTTPPMSVE
jgi:hypothetical protein